MRFANNTKAAKTVQIKNGDYEISFGLLDAKKSKIETVEKEKKPAGFYSFAELSSYASAVRYPDAYENADVEYLLRGHSLKENIILRRGGQASYIYAFEMKLKGLTPVLSGGAILLCANGETVYEIPAPFMTDAAGADSFAVHYTLSQTKKNTYTVTLTADAGWINAAERAFPVTIDPTFYKSGTGVKSAGIREEDPTQHYDKSSLQLQAPGNGKESMTLFKITDFAPLPRNAVIRSAVLTLNIEYIAYPDDPYGNEMFYTCANEIVGNWNPDTVTYAQYASGQFSISPTLLDTFSSKNSGYFYYNLTSVMQGWYDGTRPNRGVAIRATDSSSPDSIAYLKNDFSLYDYPYFILNFQDTHGVESHFEYAVSSAGAAGTGYVNAFSGELTFLHDVFTTSDAVFPYTFGFSYRSGESDHRSEYHMGAGIRMYTDERILPFDNNSDSLLTLTYTDADGTAHYFTRQSTDAPFVSEDGLKLTLEQTASGYTLTDDVGNKRIFDSGGYLTELQDIHGSRRLFGRDSGKKLTDISLLPAGSDETILQLTFTYTGDLLLTVSNIQTGVMATFTHEYSFEDENDNMCAVLTDIVYRYPQNSTYTVQYDFEGGWLCRAKDTKTGISVSYNYDSLGRVSSYRYGGNNNADGKTTRLLYASRKTTLQSPGADNLFDTADDLFTVLLFDNTGKVSSAYTTDLSVVYGAAGYTYGTTNRTQNLPLSVTTSSGADANLLSNPGFDEGTVGQTPSRFTATGSAVIKWDTVDGLENKQAHLSAPATVNGVNYTTAALSQVFRVPAGTYTLSVYYKWGTRRTNAALKIKVLNAGGTVVAESRAAKAQAGSSSSVWERLSLTFTVDGTACLSDGYTALFSLEGADASLSPQADLYLDAAMLERFSAPGTYSALGNGSFENGSDDWTLSNRADIVSPDQTVFGSKALRLGTHGGYTFANARARLTYPPAREAETDNDSALVSKPYTFLLSGWAKAPAARHYDSEHSEMYTVAPKFELRAVIHYAGTTETTTFRVPFCPSVSDWQYAVGAISTPSVTKVIGNKTYTGYYPLDYVDVFCAYEYNFNEAYFDQISFVEDSNCLTHYTYNEQGYPTAKGDSSGLSEQYTYAENGVDPVGLTTANGNSYSATYDSLHRLTGMTDPNKSETVTTTYTYDAWGNVVKSTSACASEVMVTTAEYSSSTAFLGAPIRETAADGTVTEYIYNNRGQLLCVYSPQLQRGTLYYYNDYGQLLRAVTATKQYGDYTPIGLGNTVYTYNAQGRTSTIATGSASYQFEYDDFGDMVRVAVGSRTLSTLNYAERGGRLISQSYGNGFSLSYRYDSLDRVTGICYNGSESASFTYRYNAQGRVAVHEDRINNRTYEYSYDASGRLTLTGAVDTGNRTVYLRKTEYDTLGRVSAILRYYPQAGNIPLAQQTYHYNAAGELTRVGYGATIGTEYTYDSFGRLSVSELKNTYGDRLGAKDTYFYATHGSEGALTRSSGQLRQLKKEERIGESVLTVFYTYTYDNAGNITSIEKADEDGQVIARTSYVYDKAGQLLRENVWDGLASVFFTQCYSYSDSGNLLGRIKYAYTTGAVGTPLESVDYTYGDSGYGDLLTRVGGESIVYDAIGNPTTYRGASLAFTGRRLLSYTKAGTAVSYAYDADGIRTRKTVGNVRHEYETEGGKVYRELIYNGNTLTFDLRYFYDAAGRPAMLQLLTATDSGSMESTVFYYGTNAQGDVIAIYDANGNRMVSYTYDAWGNTLSTQTNGIWGSTVSSLNPFGYRSYYYDSDTGLYYLQSRYYDPQVRRFINADDYDTLFCSPEGLTDKNLFAYCDNNPVARQDVDGEFWVTIGIMAIGGTIGAAISSISSIITQSATTGSINWKSVAVSAGAGFLSGAIAASPLGLAWQVIAGGVISGAAYAADCHVNGQEANWKEGAIYTIAGAVSGLIGGAGANKNMALSNTVNSAKKTILRESRRTNQKYAQKVISASIQARNTALANTAAVVTARYAVGLATSNAILKIYGKINSSLNIRFSELR